MAILSSKMKSGDFGSGQSYTALLVSDIHMSNRLPQARIGENGVTDRLADQIAMFGRIRQSAIDAKVDGVFILGDLFDQSRVDAITLTATVAAITKFPKPVRILPGNHDAVSTKGGRFTVEMFGVMGNPNVKYMKTGRPFRPFKEGSDWLAFHPIEYCPQEIARKHLDAVIAKPNRLDVGLLHHSILGCTHIGWTCDDGLTPEEATDPFDVTFSGHFHDSQEFGRNGMYLGAPLHLRIEDEGRNAGWWVVRFTQDEETVDRQFVDGGCPRFHRLPWFETAFEAGVPHKLGKESFQPGDYVRLEASATQAEWVLIKPKLLEMVDRLTAEGYRASFKHKPVYHHTVRIKPEAGVSGAFGSAAASPAKAVEAYVEAPEVDTNGMDLNVLKRIGREAIEHARSVEV